MLTVTEAAKQKLKATLMAHTRDYENGLRLKVKSPGNMVLFNLRCFHMNFNIQFLHD